MNFQRHFILLILMMGTANTARADSASPSTPSKPVAAIVAVTGTVTVIRSGGAEEPAATGQLLARGDALRTTAGAGVQLALENGTGYEIDGQKTVTMPPPKQGGLRVITGRAWQAMVTKFRSLWGQPSNQAVLAGTRNLAGDTSLRLIQPAPTEGPDWTLQRSKIRAERPVFLWNRVQGAARYHLRVERRDGEGRWERIVEVEDSQDPQALIVATPTDLPLQEGGIYRWFVWTEGPEGARERLPSASFRVATAKETQDLQAALERLQPPQQEPLPLDPDVLQGILFEGHGFFADALGAYYRAWLNRPQDRGRWALVTDLRERSE